MTAAEERKIQIRVGLFTLLGLVLIGAMVTYFGRLGEGMKSFYEIEVRYPNASGLLRGADVLMAGAKVGKVSSGPDILPDGDGVSVGLKIYDGVEIPLNSTFTIGSSGLLGDRFVDVTMPPRTNQEPPVQPGGIIEGQRETGISELAGEGGLMLSDVREAVQRISKVVKRLDEELLTTGTLEEVRQSISNLRSTSESLKGSVGKFDSLLVDTSGKVDVFLSTATEAVAEGKTAMQTAQEAANEGKKLMITATAAATELQTTAGEMRKIVQDTRKGRGLLGALLTDQDLADNVRALISNLRSHGVLFYKDRAKVTD